MPGCRGAIWARVLGCQETDSGSRGQILGSGVTDSEVPRSDSGVRDVPLQ